MKAEELMVGDWLYSIIFNQIQQKKIVKVVGIRTDCDNTYLQCDDTDTWYHIETYKPIPLTEKILFTNGWKPLNIKAWLGITIGCDEINIMLGKNYAEVEYLNMCFNPEDPAEINYGANFEFSKSICVHELQHILRMYDIDKEIVL